MTSSILQSEMGSILSVLCLAVLIILLSYLVTILWECRLLESVARIRVNERLRLLDFSLQNYPKGMKPVKINLFYALSQLYSKPVTEDDDTLDYIPTQYIAEFVKRIGYDGIVFKSSLYNDENSVNVVIFNFDKCEAVGSVVYDVTRNDYTCEMEDPVSELRLNFQLQLTPDNN